MPGSVKIGVLVNTTFADVKLSIGTGTASSPQLGREIEFLTVDREDAIEEAFRIGAQRGIEALLVCFDTRFSTADLITSSRSPRNTLFTARYCKHELPWPGRCN